MTAEKRIAIHRSFAREVHKPVLNLNNVDVSTIAELQFGSHTYPLLCVQAGRNQDDRPSVLVSAGVHGDEPAGVIAAISFLRDVVPLYSDQFHFVVLPCLNPGGYEANTLETMDGVNLNRSFGLNSSDQQVSAIEAWLAENQFRYFITFDLHEAPPYYRGEGFVEIDNPTGTYLYETVSDDSRRIGHELIASLPENIEVCQWPTIYEDENDGGVVAYPMACHNQIYAEKTSFDAYLNGRFSGHTFTTETPTFWDMDKRAATHLAYLETALKLISGNHLSPDGRV